MKKSKSGGPRDRLCELPRDRLCELPESLTFQILWLLPMRDVVRTTVLSKHWRNLWTTAPCLNFDYDHIGDDMNRIRDFVNRALILWEGIKIQKFKVDFHTFWVDNSFCGDFDFWLCFALRKKVQELYVKNPFQADESLPLPQNLYSCSSLQVLSLVNCCFEFNGNVQWNQLKSLTIYCAHNMSEHLISKVLCGSPQLEVLILTLADSYENLSIQSSSLKRVSIGYGEEIDRNPSCLDTKLRIWTPNLETLEISGVPYTTCLLKDVSCLTDVNLCFNSYYVQDQSVLLGETLKQVFPTIQHVKKVTLSNCCIKVLGDMINRGLRPSSSNAKFLELNNHYSEYKQILGVLQIFPKLEMLVLNGYHYRQRPRESLEFDVNLPESFLLHLRTIDITAGDCDDSVFPFMKTVLENASKLEKMVIRIASPSERPYYLFRTSQKLLRMQRSFPAVELMIFYKR